MTTNSAARRHRRRRGFIALLAASAIGVAALFGAGNSGSDDKASASDNNPPTLDERIASDLTVRRGDVLPDEALCASDVFVKNSLPQTAKISSDAVSTRFASADPRGMLQELFAEHCTNPTELDMSIQGLSQLTIGEFNIGANNPWMAEFLAKAKKDGLRTAFLTLREGEGKKIFVTSEYQEFAAMANTILLAYKDPHVQALASVQNWHLPGPVAGELPRAVLNTVQENLPALVLEYTAKGVNCSLMAIGYNVGDKRFEVFATPICEELTTPGRPTPSGAPQPPPGQQKCPEGADDPDGDGFCAIPHDPRVSQPGTDTHGAGPTPGYVPGPDGNTQTTVARQAPSPAGTPGGTQTPGGGTATGGDAGVTNPDDSPGYQNEPDW